MKEVACGCVPWKQTENKKIKVLMILRTGGFWEFPKGKKEKGENCKETALRELKEETNLEGTIRLTDRMSAQYSFTRNSVNIEKKVHLFLCEIYSNSKVSIRKREVTDFAWLSVENIVERATYPETKEMARKAEKLLKSILY